MTAPVTLGGELHRPQQQPSTAGAPCSAQHRRLVVAGRGFANSEEAAIGLTHVVPFLVEDMLKENGGIYSKAADWQPHVVVDGNLITGQNPGSAQDGGRAVLQRLAADAAPSKEHQQSTAAVADGVAHRA